MLYHSEGKRWLPSL